MSQLTCSARISLLTVLLLSFGIGPAFAQDEIRNTFFKDVDVARAAADDANAVLLAPRSYAAAIKDYDAADAGLERGRNIDYVRTKVANAEADFKTATIAAELAKTVLSQVMKSRQDAANARAPELSSEIWIEAQRKFADAIRLLERGDLKATTRREIEATSLYRDAELVAIKAEYLSETRRLLADADRARVGRYAPITLGKAKQLVFDVAEGDITEDMIQHTIRCIADVRESEEGREGLSAFLEKRPPNWKT